MSNEHRGMAVYHESEKRSASDGCSSNYYECHMCMYNLICMSGQTDNYQWHVPSVADMYWWIVPRRPGIDDIESTHLHNNKSTHCVIKQILLTRSALIHCNDGLYVEIPLNEVIMYATNRVPWHPYREFLNCLACGIWLYSLLTLQLWINVEDTLCEHLMPFNYDMTGRVRY